MTWEVMDAAQRLLERTYSRAIGCLLLVAVGLARGWAAPLLAGEQRLREFRRMSAYVRGLR